MEQVFDIKNIKVIVGLGNPGAQYCKHRHSIGFRILDALALRSNALWQHRENMEWVSVTMAGQSDVQAHELLLVKPLTFMNNSGAVMPWLLKKGIKPEQILVVHDELEKSFGQFVIRFGGSHRGHNGLKSIIATIGTDFWRLRFGIGRPENKEDVPLYVLSNFSRDEELQVSTLIEGTVNQLLGGLS